MASTKSEIRRLHEELNELDAPQVPGLHAITEALGDANASVRAALEPWVQRWQPLVRNLMERANPVTFGGLGVAALSMLAWLSTGRRHRRQERIEVVPVAAHTGRAPKRVRDQASRSRALALPDKPSLTTATPPARITYDTRIFLLGFVMPVWMLAGVADWICHRRTRIEENAGTRESLIHLLMLGQASLPIIAGLVLEITSPVLLMMFVAVALHSVTGLWDVSYAVKRRRVTPIEQHVHSYLEMVPLMATSFVTVLHWPELLALLGIGNRRPDWSLRRKARPLPIWAIGALLTSMTLFEVLPYLEELRRSRRSTHRTSG